MRKDFFRRVIGMLTAALLLTAVVPANVYASDALQGDTNKNGTVDVIMTISEGVDGFYETLTGDQLMLQELNVPYFDLALYELEEYYYNPDCYTGSSQAAGTALTANGVVTTMHVFIYATEVYMMGMDPSEAGKGEGAKELGNYISWTQGAGSSFMKFWNGSTNLNYYLDYAFPLGREGWGSTSDQQAMQDGSSIQIHLIEDKDVMGSQYGYFADAEGAWDFGTVTEGQELTLTHYRTVSSYGGTTKAQPIADWPVLYIAAEDYCGVDYTEWQELGTTDENGQILVPDTLAAGTYYLYTCGEILGGERAPAVYILEVKSVTAADLYGDADMDGYVTSKDASAVMQKAAEMDVTIDEAAADVDGDGYITSKDASYIMQFAAETITEFPVESNG